MTNGAYETMQRSLSMHFFKQDEGDPLGLRAFVRLVPFSGTPLEDEVDDMLTLLDENSPIGMSTRVIYQLTHITKAMSVEEVTEAYQAFLQEEDLDEEDFELARQFGRQDPPLSREEWSGNRQAGYRYCALILEGRIVAEAAAWSRSDEAWEVAAVYTDPDLRRKGHARAVVSFATAHILSTGRVATCTTNADNTAMIRTAESVGFSRT